MFELLYSIKIPLAIMYLAIGALTAHWYATRVSDNLYYWKYHQLQNGSRKSGRAIGHVHVVSGNAGNSRTLASIPGGIAPSTPAPSS